MPESQLPEVVRYRLDTMDRGLEKLWEELKEIRADLGRIEVELLGLKIRAGLWGAVAGGLPMLIAALTFYFWHVQGR